MNYKVKRFSSFFNFFGRQNEKLKNEYYAYKTSPERRFQILQECSPNALSPDHPHLLQVCGKLEIIGKDFWTDYDDPLFFVDFDGSLKTENLIDCPLKITWDNGIWTMRSGKYEGKIIKDLRKFLLECIEKTISWNKRNRQDGSEYFYTPRKDVLKYLETFKKELKTL